MDENKEPSEQSEQSHHNNPTRENTPPGPSSRGSAIRWKWVWLSIPVVLAIQLGMGAISMAIGSPTVASILALLAYFLGGMLIGRLSPGVTIKEPALGAAILLVTLTVLQVAIVGLGGLAVGLGTILLSLVISLVIAYAATYAGAMIGERFPSSQRGGI